MAENYGFPVRLMFYRSDFLKLYVVERRYASDPTNWFVPNKAAVESMLRSAGFRIEANPEREVYLCGLAEPCFVAEPPP